MFLRGLDARLLQAPRGLQRAAIALTALVMLAQALPNVPRAYVDYARLPLLSHLHQPDGYGTDTNYDPRAGLAQELKALNLMFSMQDVIRMMGPNSAAYIQMSDQLGSAISGKVTFEQAMHNLQNNVVTYAKSQGFTVTS